MPKGCNQLCRAVGCACGVSRGALYGDDHKDLGYSASKKLSRRRQAEAPKGPAPSSPMSVSPDPLGVLTPPQQRWRYPALAANKSLPTTIQTGTELKVLDEHDVKAGAVIAYSQATDKAEGPVTVDSSEERVFILSKKGEHY